MARYLENLNAELQSLEFFQIRNPQSAIRNREIRNPQYEIRNPGGPAMPLGSLP
ncbi:MAG TPA: hypothetical protein VGQ81_02060 [Acidobacteriota bacterium]|nr:hypothetical protein [Acidobacteriota bacterium]